MRLGDRDFDANGVRAAVDLSARPLVHRPSPVDQPQETRVLLHVQRVPRICEEAKEAATTLRGALSLDLAVYFPCSSFSPPLCH